VSRARLFAIAAGVSIVLALGGLGWEAARFGWRDDVRTHLKAELTRRVAERARAVETTATRVSRDAALIAAAAVSRDRLPELFSRLNDPIAAGPESVSATIWVPIAPGSGYRALAWTDGAAEDLTPLQISQAPGLLSVPGAGGLRLMFLRPVERDGTRVGFAAAETLLSIPSTLSRQGFMMASPVGPVHLDQAEDGTPTDPDQIAIDAPDGSPLVWVRVSSEQIAQSRQVFRWRIALVALAPWLVVWLALMSRLADRRAAASSARGAVSWSLVMAVELVAVTGALAWLLSRASLDNAWVRLLASAAALGLAALLPGVAWRSVRPLPRRRRRVLAFVAEHILGGVVLAAAFVTVAWLSRHPMSPLAMDSTHLTVIPASFGTAAGLASLLLVQVAVAWAGASVLGFLGARWRLSWRRLDAWGAFALWFASGTAAIFLLGQDASISPATGALAAGLSAAGFGLAASDIRRHYRHTSEARRLVLQFCALLAPVLAIYPLASVDQATRQVIERDYSTATQDAQQPDALSASLTAARSDIDAIGDLADLLREAGTSVIGNPLAFRIWNRTVLQRDRITSQIELYGPHRSLISKFALNVPEFGLLPQSGDQTWRGTGCDWYAFGEVARFGAGERIMLHAERELCGTAGEFLGAVVIRLIPDYRTLPFVTSANPYYEALGGGASNRLSREIPELQVVVYGWSLQPLFASGRVIWPLDDEIAGRLEHSREPFWAERTLDDGRRYHIHFRSDRGGIYAVGYPARTPLQHATRLAESAAMLMLVFVLYLTATVVLAPLLHPRVAPLGRLFAEIRASFYRKLFLFFVVAAIGPVVLFAIAFGTYMTDRLRADVESEASSVVLMARRVLDELGAQQTPIGQTRPTPDDNTMVWIRQVVDQDVNLFEGPGLRATSQRDLFDSGFLPTRTPASVYRQIALARRPVFVAEDRLGTLSYQVAAAPVPALGRDTLITVPLASRQRDIERQIDELTQGVLTGAVFLVLFAAALGASVAARVSDPVARLTRATRLVAAGRFDERLTADTADELGRLVDDFNTMTRMLAAQRDELARTNQLKAWAEMARQVAHEIKNPLTPIQLAAEHLQRVHADAQRPLGPVVDQCLTTVLKQVRLLRQIASEFSTFAGAPIARIESLDVEAVINRVVEPYLASLPERTEIRTLLAADLPLIQADRTLLARALTNLVENAIQAMPDGGLLRVEAGADADVVEIHVIDTGVGMDDENVRRAFEPYFSTKTAGSGLGLANAKRNIELCGGTVTLTSRPREGTTVTVRLPVAPRVERARA